MDTGKLRQNCAKPAESWRAFCGAAVPGTWTPGRRRRGASCLGGSRGLEDRLADSISRKYFFTLLDTLIDHHVWQSSGHDNAELADGKPCRGCPGEPGRSRLRERRIRAGEDSGRRDAARPVDARDPRADWRHRLQDLRPEDRGDPCAAVRRLCADAGAARPALAPARRNRLRAPRVCRPRRESHLCGRGAAARAAGLPAGHRGLSARGAEKGEATL